MMFPGLNFLSIVLAIGVSIMKLIMLRRKDGSRRVTLSTSRESRVEQSHKDAVNINSIIKRFNKTGYLPDPVLTGVYGDFSGSLDFHQSQDKIIQAKDAFMALPSDIREFFDNDPGALLEFVHDDSNREAAEEMGLIPTPDKPKDSNPPAAPPVPPAVAPPEGVSSETPPVAAPSTPLTPPAKLAEPAKVEARAKPA